MSISQKIRFIHYVCDMKKRSEAKKYARVPLLKYAQENTGTLMAVHLQITDD